jgi:hypothetical protein
MSDTKEELNLNSILAMLRSMMVEIESLKKN